MQINLKQVEIVEALKQYITKQGINLVGKNVDMDFTAGRKNTGLSVEIIIDDISDIPNLEEAVAETIKPVLSVVITPVAEATTDVRSTDTPAPAKSATTSLFG